MKRYFVTIVVSVILAAVLLGNLNRKKADDDDHSNGDSARETSNSTLSGAAYGIEITSKNFNRDVLENEKPVLLDFWAPHCVTCNRLSTHMRQIVQDYENSIVAGRVNVDSEMKLVKQLEVQSIPTVLFLQNGKVVQRVSGLRPGTPDWIRELVERAVAGNL